MMMNDNDTIYSAEVTASEGMTSNADVIMEQGIIPGLADDNIEIDDSFSYEGFQVVRREFFAHISEPSITFNNCKVGFNTACINKLSTIEYVQFLVNPETKTLAVRPCREEDRDSFLWCSMSNNKRKPKQSTCKMFFIKIVTLMGWNPDYRYKLLGKIIRSNGEYLIVFDLTATEIYQRSVTDENKVKTSRIPVFPAGWQDQFGLPFEEHKKSLQVKSFDGYVVYGVKEEKGVGSTDGEQMSISTDLTPTVNITAAGGDSI